MRSITRTLALAATSLAIAGAAQAGTPGAYTLQPVTAPVTQTYVAPTPTYVQPYTAGVTTETVQPAPVTAQPQVGEIIYNTQPLTAQPTETMTYGTTTETYNSTTSGSYGTTSYQPGTTGNYGSDGGEVDATENGSYVSSPIVGGNYTSGTVQ